MTADQDVDAALQGVTQDANGNPTTTALPWRPMPVRGRQIPHGLASSGATGPKTPFAFPNPNEPSTSSAFDYLEGAAEQLASRWIDPYGNVVNFFTVWVTDWLWKLDGCPTPLPQTRLNDYLTLANQLNPWPEDYVGINKTVFPNEQYATYPEWPPTTPVPLDDFLPTATEPNGSNAAGAL